MISRQVAPPTRSSAVVSPELTLGSASPRRASLLRSLGVSFETVSVDIDEQRLVHPGDLDASVRSIAGAKFAALRSLVASGLLITADTMVVLDGEIMGKPSSNDELRTLLTAMSGQKVTIVTGLCVGSLDESPETETVATTVRLRELSAQQIEDYVESGVGMDKAAGLALQAEAGPFIASVDGCWSNVVGLPLCAVAEALQIAPVAGDHHARCSQELCGSHE